MLFNTIYELGLVCDDAFNAADVKRCGTKEVQETLIARCDEYHPERIQGEIHCYLYHHAFNNGPADEYIFFLQKPDGTLTTKFVMRTKHDLEAILAKFSGAK